MQIALRGPRPSSPGGALWFLRRQKRTEPLSLLGSDGEHRHHASVDRNRIMAVPK